MNENREILLSVKNMDVCFGKRRNRFKAVDNVSFDIYKGETFGLVGESGSGKTTIGRAIIRINPTTAGDVIFKGQKINGKIPKELDRQVTRQIQMIFQDPMASLNERAKVDYIVSEGLYSGGKLNETERKHKVEKALMEVSRWTDLTLFHREKRSILVRIRFLRRPQCGQASIRSQR